MGRRRGTSRLPLPHLLLLLSITALLPRISHAYPFQSLNGQCFSYVTPISSSAYYQYIACPFANTSQLDLNNGNGFVLGLYSASSADGTLQSFSGGTYCYSVSRSSSISFRCGCLSSPVALYSVAESPTCVYKFLISTPEACTGGSYATCSATPAATLSSVSTRSSSRGVSASPNLRLTSTPGEVPGIGNQ